MSGAKIRKICVFMDETHQEMGQTISPPTRRAAAVAVIENPYAGVFSKDLETLMQIGEQLGDTLGRRAVKALSLIHI